ncbi:MAG: hypothetical protein K1X52_13655 [Pyrinomonadaceae bacterium]|nr:hypothetical protein [Pyrinomonadaceae bacterium]
MRKSEHLQLQKKLAAEYPTAAALGYVAVAAAARYRIQGYKIQRGAPRTGPYLGLPRNSQLLSKWRMTSIW